MTKNDQAAMNEQLTQLRLQGLSIDGDNRYKQDLIDAVIGAMMFGAQGASPPPAGHWLEQFYVIGREEREARAALATQPAAGEPEPCEYCGPRKHTGLPGGACESCMNTGLKYPHVEASKPVYQVENCGVWEDVSEEQQARCKDFAYRVRTLYTAPPAAAPVAAGEPVPWEKRAGARVAREELENGRRDFESAPPAAAHGDEAERKDATEAVMQRACAELPEDWYIEIHLENGSGYATLFNDGIVVDFGQDFESMGAQVEAALDAAMRAQGDGEVQ